MGKLAKKMDYYARNIKIRPKLFTTFLLISLIPVLTISILHYNKSKKALEEEIGKYTIEIARQVENRLDSFFHEIEHLVNIVGYNEDVQRFLAIDRYSEELRHVQITLNVREFISSIGKLRNHLMGVFIMNDQGLMVTDKKISQLVAQSFQFEEEPWYREFQQKRGLQLLPVHPQHYGSGEPVVTFAVRLTHVSDFEERGTLLIDFDPKIIDDMSETIQLGDTGYVFVMTEEGEAINDRRHFSELIAEDPYFQYMLNEKSGYRIMDLEGEKTLVSFYTSPRIGWKIVGVVPFSEVASGVNAIRSQSFLIVVSSILVIFVMATYISQAITNPFRRLERMMDDVKSGKFSVQLPFDRRDEIGQLERSFKHMVDELNQFQIREFRLKLLRQESEIKALQAQISPHFLYNTLNTLTCIGEVLDVKEVVTVSTSLSQMFKYNTHGGAFASLKDELAHVQAFIRIMQIRFPDRFHFDIHVPDRLAGAEVPKLVVQPIVENAFIHGMKARKEKLNLYLDAIEEHGRLSIYVKDDGAGMTITKLQELQSLFDASGHGEDDLSPHIGLFNIHQRLALHYEGRAGLMLCSDEKCGTIVQIYLPYRQHEGMESDV